VITLLERLSVVGGVLLGRLDVDTDMASTEDDTGVKSVKIDRFEGGVSWIAHPDEAIERASHALVVDEDVWVVDPVDTADLDHLLGGLGQVAGVVVLLDRHTRDAGAVASRHGVAVHLPHQLHAIRDEFDTRVETFETELADTGYRSVPVVTNRFWREVALYREADRTLVVPEALGTVAAFCAPNERLGVHPALRLIPPRTALGGLAPERVLVGHGGGITNDASAAFRDALRGARSRAPRFYLDTARETSGI